MVFYVKQDGLFLMISTDNKLCFRVKQEKLSEKTKRKYRHLLNEEGLIFTYPNDEFWIPPKDVGTHISGAEIVKSKEISKQAMVEAINSLGKSSIIYTGAGISRAADIMTCDELYKALSISGDYDAMIDTFIGKTAYVLAQFKMFHMRLMHSKPTEAHLKIAEIIKEKKCRLVSENLDNLHEKTGVHAIYANDHIGELMDMRPDKVFLFGIGRPMCSQLFDRWYEHGAEFFAINSTYTELNVPTNIYLGNIQEFLVIL